MQPETFCKASGNIIRKVLQTLEKTGLAKQGEKGGYKGRIVTPKGHAILEEAASAILKEKGIELKAKPKTELSTKKKAAKKKTAKKKATKKKAAKKEEKGEAKPEKKTETKKEEKPVEKKAAEETEKKES